MRPDRNWRVNLAQPTSSPSAVTKGSNQGVDQGDRCRLGAGVCWNTGGMQQAIQSTRPGGFVSYVGVPHGVELDGQQTFFSHIHLHGGPAPVRRYLPTLIDLIVKEKSSL